MTRLTIALDCDGVLFDCNSYVIAIAERVLDRRMPSKSQHRSFEFTEALGITQSEMDRVAADICSGRPTRDMSYLRGAASFVDTLLGAGHDVFFLTSHWRGCPNWVTDREARLNKMWPQCDVVFTHNKTRASFDFLLDDKVSTIEAVGAAGLLFDQPWNADAKHLDSQRFHSYESVLRFLGVTKS